VQVTGGGSYTITLPKDWIRMHGVTKGSEVDLHIMPDGSLCIKPVHEKGRQQYSATVYIDGSEKLWPAVRRIISYYTSGVTTINIVFKGSPEPELAKKLREFVARRLIGVEVVEESSQRITLQTIAEPRALPLQTSFRRLARTVGHMLEDVVRALKEGSKSILEEVEERDDIVDKFYIFIVRQVNSILLGLEEPSALGVSSLAEASLYKMAAKFIERIGDHATIIASSIKANIERIGSPAPSCVYPSLLDYAEKVLSCYQDTINIFLNRKGDVDQEIEEAIALRRLGDTVAAQTQCIEDMEVILNVRRCLESFRRTLEYSIDVLEVSINMEVLKDLEKQMRSL